MLRYPLQSMNPDMFSVIDPVSVADYRCPCCIGKLEANGSRLYETLVEHVLDPNNETPNYRPTLRCSNHSCITYKNVFWSDAGEEFTEVERHHTYTKMMAAASGNLAPFGSYQRMANVKYSDANRKWYKFGLFGIKIEYDLEVDYTGTIRHKTINRIELTLPDGRGDYQVKNLVIVDTYRQWKVFNESVRRLEKNLTGDSTEDTSPGFNRTSIQSSIASVTTRNNGKDTWRRNLRWIMRTFYMSRLQRMDIEVELLK